MQLMDDMVVIMHMMMHVDWSSCCFSHGLWV